MTRTTTYFAYGSNLSPAQIRHRCPHARLVARATLGGHRLAFAGHSRAWGGGVATVTREPTSVVSGVIYELPVSELLELDHYEGHPVVYERRRRLVIDDVGRRRRPHLYIRPPGEETLPGAKYFGVIWRAYTKLGFDRRALASAIGEVA